MDNSETALSVLPVVVLSIDDVKTLIWFLSDSVDPDVINVRDFLTEACEEATKNEVAPDD